MSTDIVLIGPGGAGKSTQGKLLAEALGLPQRSMDDLRWDYYKEIGFSEETQKQIGEKEGFTGIWRYWKPFEAHAVERLLSEHQDCVIDFGAGHSVYEDDALFARVQTALAPYTNVVLLLPSPERDESVSLLRTRGRFAVYIPSDIPPAATPEAPPPWSGLPPLDEFDRDSHIVHCLTHRSNYDLATIIVYTKDRTPEQTRDEILAAVAARERTDGL